MIGAVIGAKYKVEKKIGEGGFAVVYRATDVKLKRPVAIKVLTAGGEGERFKEGFLRESEALATLNHPNILTVFDCGDHEGRPYLVMELVNGPSLDSLVSKTSLSLSQVFSLGQQICSAMAYAHEQGIVHRDLTLKNIMLEEESEERARVKILDFGLVKLLGSGMQTTGNAMMGTPFYMAPEQVMGKTVDERVDIWAFGVGLFRMLTGRFPFEAEHPAAVMYLITNGEVEFGEGTSEEFQRTILHCLEKDPRSRPRSFGEVARELGEIQNTLTSATSATTTTLSKVSAFRTRGSRRNPYLNRVMIKNPADFVGREREVRKIYSRLDAPQPQSISVVGDRRIGKSSLLNFIYNKKNRKRHMENHASSIFVFLDFQNIVSLDVPRFIDFLFNVFSFEMDDGSQYTKRPKTLDELKAVVQELHEKGKRIIVLMDEFEIITKNENFEEDFFSFLRSLANSYRMAYVTSSADELQHMCHNEDISDSPFFNIFSNLPLLPFGRKEAVELITVPSRTEGVPLEAHEEKILELSGHFPFHLQIACSAAFEHLVENPEGEPDWAEIGRTFRDEVTPHYSFVWERMEEAERQNLVRVASGRTVERQYAFVNEGLERRGYLVKEESGFRLFSKPFDEYVRQQGGGDAGKGSVLSSLFGRFRGKKGRG
ncbi:MAG: protein kinase [Candidatus Eisenbacteria bacterium]